MEHNGKDTTYFGLTSFRNERKKFGIKRDDRRRHFYTIGKTGMGKSKLMENMAIQDIQNGNGIAYVDPHGEGAEGLLDYIPKERIKDVVYFNPADLDHPIAFNVMEKVEFKYRHLVAGGLMAVFKKVWPDVWSARMEYILSNAILALLEYPDSTLLGVNRMLSDPEYRARVVAQVKDPIVRSFWVTEYARYTQRYEIEATAAIQNKVGQFVSNALIRNVIGQVRSTVNMRKIMDNGKILILDLSKGRIGEDNSRLLGALLITKIQLAAMSRVDIPEDERKDFYLYVDEFQNFATESFANILSEARKYRLCLTIGHQYIGQLEDKDTKVRDAVFGNVGTMAVFRVGAEDAEFLEKEFSPEFTAEDLVNLSKYNIYLKLMIDGVASHPFSAHTLPPPTPPADSNRDEIIAESRQRYGVKREMVEQIISDWTLDGEKKIAASDEHKSQIQNPKSQINSKFQIQNPKPQISMPSIQEDGTTLYSAKCDTCGKDTRVIFEPTPGKPIYCKSCLKKMRSAKEGAKSPAIARATLPGQSAPRQNMVAAKNVDESQKVVPPADTVLMPVPPPVQPAIEVKNLSFNQKRQDNWVSPKRQELAPPSRKASDGQRKEINLSELKKMIDESLERDRELRKDESGEDNGEEIEEVAMEEKPLSTGNPVPEEKRIINPGQKVNL